MMTKEDFRAGILDAIEDMNDPNGEFNRMVADGHEIVDEVRAFDPELGLKVKNIVVAIEAMGAYVRARAGSIS